jgi:hypothetical protein
MTGNAEGAQASSDARAASNEAKRNPGKRNTISRREKGQ